MARLARLTLPDYPHHIIQRGNNRQPIFLDREDYETMLALFAEQTGRNQVAIHAYILMENHFHLLATPQTEHGLSRFMQAVGRSYVRYYNRRHGRTGTLWEGRYRSTVLEPDRYFLPCMVYIDLNPVRMGAVAHALEHPWSSHAHWVGLRQDKWVSSHPLYWALGNTPFAREAAYGALVQAGVNAEQQARITDATLNGWALGRPDFVQQLQTLTSRRVTKSRAGRPSLRKL